MRRTSIGLAATGLAALALAGPAAAATTTTPTSMYASAVLVSFGPNGDIMEGDVAVTKSKQGSELQIEVTDYTYDVNGNPTRSITTNTDVTSGFDLKFQDPGRLGGATVAAASVPATSCTYDANGNQTGCVASTFTGLSVTWHRSQPLVTGVDQFSASVVAPTFDGIVWNVHEAFIGYNY